MTLLVFCFLSFALSAGAVFLCCFAVAADGVTMCRRVTVAMLDGQIVQSSGLLVQVGGSLKGGSRSMLCFPSPFVCFAGSASGKPHVFRVDRLTGLKLDFSPPKFCRPVGCMCAKWKCFSVTPIGSIHNPLCCSVVSDGGGALARGGCALAGLFGDPAGILGAKGCLYGFSQEFVLQHSRKFSQEFVLQHSHKSISGVGVHHLPSRHRVG